MTTQRVDFYLLNQSVPDGKLRAACRLGRKAVNHGMTAYIRTGDPEQAARLDDLLWTFDQGSFIPHRLAGDGDDPAPVLIGCKPPVGKAPDILITLTDGGPEDYRDVPRIAEVVDAIDEDKRAARQRYKLYKERGCELNTHPIDP